MFSDLIQFEHRIGYKVCVPRGHTVFSTDKHSTQTNKINKDSMKNIVVFGQCVNKIDLFIAFGIQLQQILETNL